LERRVSTDSISDELLMVRLSKGHDDALTDLMRKYQNDIFRFCLHYLRNVDVAKEMAQETFIRVYTARLQFDPARRFRPWVLCIARNLCLNELKRKKLVSMESIDQYASNSRDESGEVFQHSGEGADEILIAQERRQALDLLLSKLNTESRELITLRFFERMSAREIAEVIGSTEGAVRTKLHRVLTVLRENRNVREEEML